MKKNSTVLKQVGISPGGEGKYKWKEEHEQHILNWGSQGREQGGLHHKRMEIQWRVFLNVFTETAMRARVGG